MEPSDVSSDGLSDFEKSSAQRGAASVELTDLPVLYPSNGDPVGRAKEDLAEFWQTNPVSALEFEGLGEHELGAVNAWMDEVKITLETRLAALRQELRAEWAAKEQVLDQLLQASIGTTLTVEQTR